MHEVGEVKLLNFEILSQLGNDLIVLWEKSSVLSQHILACIQALLDIMCWGNSVHHGLSYLDVSLHCGKGRIDSWNS